MPMQYTEILEGAKLKKKIITFFFVYFSYFNFAQNIDGGYTLEPPWRVDSNEYPQSMFWIKNKKENRYTHAYPVLLYEPHREKTGFLPMRKQRRRSASR